MERSRLNSPSTSSSRSRRSWRRRFADEHPNRFDGVGFTRGTTGAPIIDDCLAVIECEVQSRHPAGDHTIVIGAVIASATSEGSPLLYYRGGYATLER